MTYRIALCRVRKKCIIGTMTFVMLMFYAGCGGSSSSTPGADATPVPTATPISTATATPVPTSTSTPAPSVAPQTYSFSITGSGTYTTPTIHTDTVLKVTISAGLAKVVSGTGFTPVFGCVSYTVTVDGQSVQTDILSNGTGDGDCYGSPQSQTIDFSGRLGSGHNSMTVEVSDVQNDFRYLNCIENPSLYSVYPYGPYSCTMYYPVTALYKTHVASGNLSIQVNGSSN